MKQLFVGNLPFGATQAEMQAWFTAAGITVRSVEVAVDRFSGQPRGFAVIEVADEAEAKRAIVACNGKDFNGRNVLIDHIRPVTEPRQGTQRETRTPRKGRKAR